MERIDEGYLSREATVERCRRIMKLVRESEEAIRRERAMQLYCEGFHVEDIADALLSDVTTIRADLKTFGVERDILPYEIIRQLEDRWLERHRKRPA